LQKTELPDVRTTEGKMSCSKSELFFPALVTFVGLLATNVAGAGEFRTKIDASRVAVGPSGGASDIFTGGGPEFVDDPMPSSARIAGIGVQHNDHQVIAICLIYEFKGDFHLTKLHGMAEEKDKRGRYDEFKLAKGEHFVSIKGRTGTGVDKIIITISEGRSMTFGGPGGTNDFNLTAPKGREIDGFFGNSNNCLTRIGLLTRPLE
jgi:hypothetical protein